MNTKRGMGNEKKNGYFSDNWSDNADSSDRMAETGTEETASEDSKEADKLQIGLSFDSFVIERWLRDRDMFVSTAQGLGAEVNVQVAGGRCG